MSRSAASFAPHYLCPMRHLTLVLLFSVWAMAAMAQQDSTGYTAPVAPAPLADRSFHDSQILLKQEFTGGLIIHSRGWGINLRRSKNRTFKRKRIFELDAVSVEHPKEISIVSAQDGNASSFVYGEQFQMVTTRFGYGRQNVIFGKFDRGVEIRVLYLGGFSLGWAKPIYLDIIDRQTGTLTSERYDPAKHNLFNIYGGASPMLGITEMKFHPGLYVKGGFSFEYAQKPKSVRSIEAGMILDAYLTEVQLMANNPAERFFFTFYLSMNFGLKWYR